MDIWGDPWADTAKPELPSTNKVSIEHDEVTDYDPVRPAATGFDNGFEDEAGWGDFEESTGIQGLKEVERSGNEELRWSDRQGHEEDTTNGLAPEPHFGHENGSGILSPGWGSVQTFPAASNPHQDEKENDDTYTIPPSPIWESPRSSISSPRASHEIPIGNDIISSIRRTTPDERPVSETLSRPSTSSTTKTAVSADEFSETPISPSNHNERRWAQESSHSDASGGTENSDSPTSLRTSFDEIHTPFRRSEESGSHMEELNELPVPESDSMQTKTRAEVDEEQARAHALLDKVEEHSEGEAHILLQESAGPRFVTNFELVKDLFKPEPPSSEKQEEPNDELIDSTSTRKAWYRLARPQTLREFNTGATDDSYVRVSWPRSHVRSETLKIVTKWASEDRINGRVVLGGKTGAAAFGWDMPSDGSIMPPRQTSMTKQAPSRNESGKHYAAHERKPSMPHHSALTNSSPVAHFSWSTSPTGNGRPGSGIIASLGDVLEPRATPRASEEQLQVTKQRQTSEVTSPPTKPSAPGPDPQSTTVAELRRKQTTGQLGLSRLDTTKSTLNTNNVEDDDDDWGEMVKSPSAPPSPAFFPIPAPAGARDIKPIAKNEEHIPIISSRRRPTPIAAPPAAQILPESMLSPARKAAFDAARATRFLHSQQNRSESPPVDSNGARATTPRSRGVSPSSLPMMGSLGVLSPSSSKGLLSPAIGNPPAVAAASASFLEADLSFFNLPPPPTPLPPSMDRDAPVQLSPDEEERAQQIVRNIPNLSFMLQ